MEQRDLQYVSSLHGGFWPFNIKDFRYMTNPYFPPDEFIKTLQSRLKELVKSYPSTNWRISSLVAEPLGLAHQHVVVANGASELISAISSLYVENLAVPVPTFDEFPNRAVIQGKRVSLYQLDGDFDLDAGGFIQHAMDNQANSALFIRPNNPTGNHLSKQTLRNLLEFVDETAHEPSPRTPLWGCLTLVSSLELKPNRSRKSLAKASLMTLSWPRSIDGGTCMPTSLLHWSRVERPLFE